LRLSSTKTEPIDAESCERRVATVKRGILTEPFIYDLVTRLQRYTPWLAADGFDGPVLWPQPRVVLTPRSARHFSTPLHRFLTRRFLMSHEYMPWAMPRRTLARKLADDPRALIHAHYAFTAVWLGGAQMPLDRTVVSLYCNDVFAAGKHPHWHAAYRRIMPRVSMFLALSQYIAEFWVDLGCPPDKVRIDRQAIDLTRFSYRAPVPTDTPTILCLSYFQNKKGLAYLVRAFARIASKHPGARLRLVGTGPEESRVRQLIRELRIAERVTIEPTQAYETLPALFQGCDIFVLPSTLGSDFDVDELSMVTVQALATGLPVITTHHAGIGEVVRDGTNGVLVHERNVDELALAIDDLLSGPEIWESLARAGRATAEKTFDIDARVRAVEDCYDRVAAST
jgi:glycosyltransferase involved in cell wall biosynthesis